MHLFRCVCLISLFVVTERVVAQPTNPPSNALVPAGEGLLATPGFQVSLVACEPLVVNPAAMCVAPDGRIFVCEEYVHAEIAGVKRDTVKVLVGCEQGGPATGAVELAGDLNSVQGLAFHDGKLYIAHSPNISVLEVSQENKPGVLVDLVTGIGRGPKGFSPSHQASGLLVHEGKLYIAFGDEGCDVATREWGRIVLDTGGILRCDLDGSHLEVFAHGFRNIYGVAVDPLGHVFTRENDNDGGGYNCRSYHVVKGGYYGWPFRYREGDSEPPAPDVLTLSRDQGHGSSTGCRYLANDHFPAPFNQGVMFADWTKAKILFSRPVPKGATFDLPEEPFLADQNVRKAKYQFRPTAVELAPDGSLIVADMGTLWLHSRERVGRVLRVTYTGRDAAKAALPVGAALNAATATAELLDKLSSSDAGERAKAALLLGDRQAKAAGSQLLTLLHDDAPEVRLRAATALGDLHDASHTPGLVAALEREPDRWVRFALVHALRSGEDFSGIETALKGASEQVQRDLLYALRDVRHPQAVAILTGVARANVSPTLRAKAVELLGVVAKRGRHIRSGGPVPKEPLPTETWSETDAILQSLREFARDARPVVQSAALDALQKLQDKGLVDLVLADLKAGRAKLDDRTALILARSVGGERAEPELVDYLRQPGSADVRLEVVRLLSLTKSPDSLTVLRDVAFNSSGSLDLQATAMSALGRRRDAAALPQLVERLSSGPIELRRAAAHAVGSIVERQESPRPELQRALEAAADDVDASLQVQAVAALWRLGDVAATESALRRMLGYSPADDALQLELLGLCTEKVRDRDEPLVLLWLETDRLGRKARDLALSRLRKWAKTDFALVGAFGAKRQEALDQLAAYRRETYPTWKLPAVAPPSTSRDDEEARLAKVGAAALEGAGDPIRGAAVFRNKNQANCIACHRVQNEGGMVGPDLSEIGGKYLRPVLIESILFPSKQIQPGYEVTVLQLDSGQTIQGIVREDTPSRVTIALNDGSLQVLAPKEIEFRNRSTLSAMPLGLANKLTQAEFVDLLAYLESLKKQDK
jgi:putative membrane-bound dehydrogenase-like protein